METYSLLRQLADSWVLLAMFGFFVSVILWAFRPGSTKTYDAIAQIPLREDSTMGAAQTTRKGASDV
ncbi:CcoQ/FixQ family Cbb3-type cytochrome c oxidase assembly chaperone [Sulfitobacter sp. 20_GPM-1509m]|uniref:CcoQ/FixQ family Cbb3-type cytochrome c oxidase assembly chaperone n=1 Tax=Sulfitobacter sp. 20_GPM-1509m TaxID=1380367 RepID=UPI0005664B9F|nr:CcoQ/FixQ family Cbb3-type cytochrome c oxidase assembly chaperone [Sulfitobacter sp. 20_GPM-1509m]